MGRQVSQLIDRFGSNRMNAAEPGKLLRGCTCVNVPFAGGMCEVPHFTANIVNVNDLDCAVMNLCEIVRDSRARLVSELDSTPFHPAVLRYAQEICKRKRPSEMPCFEWAYHLLHRILDDARRQGRHARRVRRRPVRAMEVRRW